MGEAESAGHSTGKGRPAWVWVGQGREDTESKFQQGSAPDSPNEGLRPRQSDTVCGKSHPGPLTSATVYMIHL